MIVGSLLGTLGAIILAVPIAILSSIAISELLPSKVASVVRTAVEILASIPSVLYGIFGLGVVVP